MQTLEFFIDRRHGLTMNGADMGRFGSEAEAADFAVRLAQDQGALWSIFYPL